MNDIEDNGTFKLEFYDGAHGIAKFTAIVKAGLDFAVFVYHWPIPDDRLMSNTLDLIRSVNGLGTRQIR